MKARVCTAISSMPQYADCAHILHETRRPTQMVNSALAALVVLHQNILIGSNITRVNAHGESRYHPTRKPHNTKKRFSIAKQNKRGIVTTGAACFDLAKNFSCLLTGPQRSSIAPPWSRRHRPSWRLSLPRQAPVRQVCIYQPVRGKYDVNVCSSYIFLIHRSRSFLTKPRNTSCTLKTMRFSCGHQAPG